MTPLEHLAARVASDPFFLAHALAGYAARRGLADADLCDRLGCTPEVLTRLRLCRMPDHAGEVGEIAMKMGVNAAALGRVVFG